MFTSQARAFTPGIMDTHMHDISFAQVMVSRTSSASSASMGVRERTSKSPTAVRRRTPDATRRAQSDPLRSRSRVSSTSSASAQVEGMLDEFGLPITYTPATGRISKAKKGKRVHVCEYGCGKVYSRAEHRKRHEANHRAEMLLACPVQDCKKPFKRADLLSRHMEKQHGYPAESSPSEQQTDGTSNLFSQPSPNQTYSNITSALQITDASMPQLTITVPSNTAPQARNGSIVPSNSCTASEASFDTAFQISPAMTMYQSDYSSHSPATPSFLHSPNSYMSSFGRRRATTMPPPPPTPDWTATHPVVPSNCNKGWADQYPIPTQYPQSPGFNSLYTPSGDYGHQHILSWSQKIHPSYEASQLSPQGPLVW